MLDHSQLAAVVCAALFPPSAWSKALGVLALVLLASGIDDLIPVFLCLWGRLRTKQDKPPPQLSTGPPRRIAVFVPCWKEAAVIGNMVRHNQAAIRYPHFDFFLGVYPNDPATMDAVEELAQSFSNVHVAPCTSSGPTSKADCLNSIYARLRDYETQTGARFETVVLHDAEDIIHPNAFRVIEAMRVHHHMVQVPVLPVPTAAGEATHGIYCDEFSEFQVIDMPARQISGSFIPSNGVGTGFAREILDRLWSERDGLVFNPGSLTEDYEMGVYIHKAGYRQVFVPLEFGNPEVIATREYFPRKLNSAIRQRTRWITGIALQSWQRDGWSGPLRVKYWFWRDRKGLLLNPLSLLTNVLFMAGIATWVDSRVSGRPWVFASQNAPLLRLFAAVSTLQTVRILLRALCVGRFFGFSSAAAAPFRILHCNLINSIAGFRAVWTFSTSRLHKRELAWSKTEHHYPTQGALQHQKRDLTDVLVTGGYVDAIQLLRLKEMAGSDIFLEDLLLDERLLTEHQLSQAVSLQSGFRVTAVDIKTVRRQITRSLPAHVQKRFAIVPFDVQDGRLLVAATRVPDADALDKLQSFSRLPVEMHVVTRENFRQLRDIS